jgi:hypothetical protein
MKKELALIIGAVVVIFLIYPLTLLTYLGSSWSLVLMFPLFGIVLYSIFHALNLLHNKMGRKAIVFVIVFVVAVFVSFQFVLLLIRFTVPFVV